MKRTWILMALTIGWVSLSPAVTPVKKRETVVRPAPSDLSSRGKVRLESYDPDFARIKFNSFMGALVLKGTALDTGFEFGYAPVRDVPLYIGPDVHFSLFGVGSIFSLMAAAWYEIHLSHEPRFILSIGGDGGVGITRQLSYLRETSTVVFFDLGLSEEVDDLASIRIDFRPGYVEDNLSFLTDIAISFRFP